MVEPEEMAHHEPPNLVLCCLQLQLCSFCSLSVKFLSTWSSYSSSFSLHLVHFNLQ